jgi:hypothetical protein
MLVSGLLGCQAIVDMDKTTAPADLMWTKPGVSNEEKSRALTECANRIRQREDLMRAKGIVQFDFNAICMLNKGYTFVPKPKGYINWCHSQMFPNSIACKSYRGEYPVDGD